MPRPLCLLQDVVVSSAISLGLLDALRSVQPQASIEEPLETNRGNPVTIPIDRLVPATLDVARSNQATGCRARRPVQPQVDPAAICFQRLKDVYLPV